MKFITDLYRNTKAKLAADKAKKAEADRRFVGALALAGVAALALVPELAMAGTPWDGAGAWFLSMLNSGLTRTIAIGAVCACGIAGLAGKLSWDWAIKIIVGITLIFGSAAIVDAIIAAVS